VGRVRLSRAPVVGRRPPLLFFVTESLSALPPHYTMPPKLTDQERRKQKAIAASAAAAVAAAAAAAAAGGGAGAAAGGALTTTTTFLSSTILPSTCLCHLGGSAEDGTVQCSACRKATASLPLSPVQVLEGFDSYVMDPEQCAVAREKVREYNSPIVTSSLPSPSSLHTPTYPIITTLPFVSCGSPGGPCCGALGIDYTGQQAGQVGQVHRYFFLTTYPPRLILSPSPHFPLSPFCFFAGSDRCERNALCSVPRKRTASICQDPGGWNSGAWWLGLVA
jgi:hypothetical protein